MTVAQLRQYLVGVQQKRYRERQEHRRLISWQTRTIAQYVAATVQLDEKAKTNPVMDSANKIALDKLELAELEIFMNREDAEDEDGLKGFQAQEGSYEALAAKFAQGFNRPFG